MRAADRPGVRHRIEFTTSLKGQRMPTQVNRYDIRIELHLHGRDGMVDSKSLLRILDVIEAAIYNSDRTDVDHAARELQLSPVIRDACLERLRQYRHQRLLLQEARPGSLELIGLVAGVSYFVLERTIGESVSEAYKESRYHARLKEFFRRLIDEKALILAEAIRRLLASRKKEANVRTLPRTENEPNTIVIQVPPESVQQGYGEQRTLGQSLD